MWGFMHGSGTTLRNLPDLQGSRLPRLADGVPVAHVWAVQAWALRTR